MRDPQCSPFEAQPPSPFPLLAAATRIINQIFMPNFLPLPTLGWPSMGATQSDGGADVGENHGVTEDSNGEMPALLPNAGLQFQYLLTRYNQSSPTGM